MTPGDTDAGGEAPLSLTCARLLVLPARDEHAPLIQACLEESAAYFLRTDGAPPAADAAAHLLSEAEVDDRRQLLAVFSPAGEAVLGVLDLHLHHPEPGVAHLGLLLLRESARGRGYGRELVAALEAALARAGFHALRLSVVRQNPEARAFWEAVGYAEAGEADRGVTSYEKLL